MLHAISLLFLVWCMGEAGNPKVYHCITVTVVTHVCLYSSGHNARKTNDDRGEDTCAEYEIRKLLSQGVLQTYGPLEAQDPK